VLVSLVIFGKGGESIMNQIEYNVIEERKNRLAINITYNKLKPLLRIEIDFLDESKFPVVRIERNRADGEEECIYWGIPEE